MVDVNQIHHETGRRAEERIARAFQNYPNPTIQEHIFTSTFLPMFVGGGPFMNVDAWRAIAGTLNKEVDVYRGDEYLYTIPPVQLETRAVISQRAEGHGMNTSLNGAFINMANDLKDPNIYALVGSQVEQAEEMVIDNAEENLARWEAIFARYNIDYKEVRKEVGRLKFGIDVKDDINDSSSKKKQIEEIEFDDTGDFSY